jgi:hypothetical protein
VKPKYRLFKPANQPYILDVITEIPSNRMTEIDDQWPGHDDAGTREKDHRDEELSNRTPHRTFSTCCLEMPSVLIGTLPIGLVII